jgi:hypothetical protein
MLFVSIARLENPSLRLTLAMANTLIWLTTLCVDISLLVFKLYFLRAQPSSYDLGAGDNYLAFLLPAIVMVLCALVYSVVVVSVRKVSGFPRNMTVASVALTMAFALCALLANRVLLGFYDAPLPAIGGYLLLALALMGIFQFTKDKAYAFMAIVALGVDLFVMLPDGYGELAWYGEMLGYGTVLLPGLYLLLGIALLFILYLQMPLDVRAKVLGPARLITIPYVELALAAILVTPDLIYGKAALFLLIALALTLFFLLGLDRRPYPDLPLHYLLKVNELLLFFTVAAFIAIDPRDTLSMVLYALVTVVCLALVALRVSARSVRPAAGTAGPSGGRPVGGAAGKTAFDVFYALAFTVLTLALIYGSTDWFSEPYALSLVSMVLALASITFGFVMRNKALRIYGLVLVMVCVLKLLVFDLGELNSLLRVIAFIGGGVICFVISALYNFAVKRFDGEKPKAPLS